MKSKFHTGEHYSRRDVEDWLNSFSGHLVIHSYKVTPQIDEVQGQDYSRYDTLVEEYLIPTT